MHINKALTTPATILLGLLSFDYCEGRDANEAQQLRRGLSSGSTSSIFSDLLSANYTELYQLLDTAYQGECETDVGGPYGLEEIIVTCNNDKGGTATLTANQQYDDQASQAIPIELQVCTEAAGQSEDPNHNTTSQNCNDMYFTGDIQVDVEAAKKLLHGEQVTLFEDLVLLMNATYQGTCHSNSILLLGAPTTSWYECDLPNGVSAKLTINYESEVIPPQMSLQVCNSNPFYAGVAPSGNNISDTDGTDYNGDDGDCKQMSLDSDEDIEEQLNEAQKLLETWM